MRHSKINRKSKTVNLKSKGGFTLIELLVVIVIMMFLAGITVPIVSSIQTNARKGVASAQISQLGLALKQFESDFGFFPPQSYTAAYSPSLSLGGVAIPRDNDLSSGSRCLVFFLGSKFEFTSPSFTATYGPYIEFKRSQLSQVSGADFSDTEAIQYINVDGINGQPNVYEYKDPFGSYYFFDSINTLPAPTINNTASFDIYSYGPDKNDDSGVSTSDDITNW